MRLFLNPNAGYGTALQRWQRIADAVEERLGCSIEMEHVLSEEECVERVKEAVRSGETEFLGAGGDGTVNLLLNTLMTEARDPGRITIGAIGLGSSNDFHKPFSDEAIIRGIPMRMDFGNARPVDVIRVDCWTGSREPLTRFCLCNASIGITAEANSLYNSRPLLIQALKRFSVNAAITAVALKTLLTYHNLAVEILGDDRWRETCRVTNLGIIKNPHFAGNFRYDTPVSPDDGRLVVNLSRDQSFLQRILLLIQLQRGRFLGFPNTRSEETTRLAVSSEQTFAIEMDGELEFAQSAIFTILPKAIRCCP
jgi:diacylglycerol kinase family enzyme